MINVYRDFDSRDVRKHQHDVSNTVCGSECEYNWEVTRTKIDYNL